MPASAVSSQRKLRNLEQAGRRRSKSRGKLFFRLMQQAVGTSPKTYDTLIGGTKTAKRAAQQVGVW
jgi:hypothetical protein